ncbi:MAG: MBOAT family protein [Deltaproteobacteria bacterium]|nr:MBOAT family protein [Deltaproteobacteria bacterium]
MMFHSAQYLALVVVAVALYWFVSRPLPAGLRVGLRTLRERRTNRLAVLAAASLAFYAAWSAAPLLIFSGYALVNFTFGRALDGTRRPWLRKLWLALAVGLHLGGLFAYKYLDFALRSWTSLAELLGLPAGPAPLGLLLPVGLSFVAFQAISYIVDVYRGDADGTYSYGHHWVFLLFFPQVIAGPIVRARDLLDHLDDEPSLTTEDGVQGVFRIAQGVAKKLLLADVLATALVDPVFASPTAYTSAECLVAAVAYTFEIYFDFSAYSDIAIGTAALFGFRLPENFDKPYHARNLFEFWNRWHVSLSTWLRDYLYRPLGGSRGGKLLTLRNLMLVMVLGGLWHGADWRFAVWGGLHGVFLVALRVKWWVMGKPTYERWLSAAVGVVITFSVVVLTRIFFRAASVDAALEYFRHLGALTGGVARVTPLAWAALWAAVFFYTLPRPVFDWAGVTFARLPAPVRAALLIALGLLIKRIASFETQPYIYFQF